MTVFETIKKCREHFENMDAHAWIMTLFETAMRKTVHILI